MPFAVLLYYSLSRIDNRYRETGKGFSKSLIWKTINEANPSHGTQYMCTFLELQPMSLEPNQT